MLAAGEKCTKNYFLLAVEMEQKIGSTEPVQLYFDILSYGAGRQTPRRGVPQHILTCLYIVRVENNRTTVHVAQALSD
jgi:hypothetical protein